MQLIAQCYHYLFWGALLLLGAGLIAVLVYIIRSHLTVDRIIGHNLIGTLVVICHLDSDLSAWRGLSRRHRRGIRRPELHRRGDALPHLYQSL